MFFSLSIGLGVMITYGSYLGKQEHLQRNAFIVCGADTLIALMAGMAVMPACSAFGVEYGAGPGLLFASMQTVFSHMGSVGNLIGFLFYLLVLIAALTSSISMLELCTAYAVDKQIEKGLTPKRAKHTSEVAALVFIAGSLVALDGLGAGVAGGAAVETPATLLGLSVRGWNDCWLDLYDMVAEGYPHAARCARDDDPHRLGAQARGRAARMRAERCEIPRGGLFQGLLQVHRARAAGVHPLLPAHRLLRSEHPRPELNPASRKVPSASAPTGGR